MKGYGGERAGGGEVGDLEDVDAPDLDVLQALAQLLLVAGHHAVLGHPAGDGVEAVGVGQGLVAHSPDGAHHLAPLSSISLVKVSLAGVLKVNLLVFVCNDYQLVPVPSLNQWSNIKLI